MASLEDRLARIREGSKDQIPDEALERMHRATEELAESDAVERAVGSGDEAPAFSLPDSQGRTVSLEATLEDGPVVLVFFRGHW